MEFWIGYQDPFKDRESGAKEGRVDVRKKNRVCRIKPQGKRKWDIPRQDRVKFRLKYAERKTGNSSRRIAALLVEGGHKVQDASGRSQIPGGSHQTDVQARLPGSLFEKMTVPEWRSLPIFGGKGDVILWYVIQVFTGKEEKMKELCESRIPREVLEQCFIPYYEEMKKYLGEWHREKKVLFPGYLFAITEQVDALYEQLKKVQGFTKLLGDQMYLLPLTDSEVEFLRRFGGEDHIVEMSRGMIENDRIIVTEGPLQGMEGCIKRIDRHKRKAEIQIEMFGRMVDAVVGLEIIRKSGMGKEG